MDADREIIPIVEDDQGEGFRDPLDRYDIEKLSDLEKQLKKQSQRMAQSKHIRRGA